MGLHLNKDEKIELHNLLRDNSLVAYKLGREYLLIKDEHVDNFLLGAESTPAFNTGCITKMQLLNTLRVVPAGYWN